jgi:hypothetical protein
MLTATFSAPREAPVSTAIELLAILVLAWLAFAAIPMTLGQIGLSWDALNHHIYLGWTAESPRFDRDVLPATYQTYQFPYLYWPVYKLATSGWSGRSAGMALAALHLLAVPPVWLMTRYCIPGNSWFDVSMRAMGVGLGFLTGVVLSLFDSTSNDLLAAIPFLWALALALRPFGARPLSEQSVRNGVLWSGLLAGVSVACKWSNGPLTLLLPVLWLLAASGYRRKLAFLVAGGTLSVVGLLLAYGPWGWQLWRHFGNPIFPFLDAWFEPLRSALGWMP